MSAQLGRVLFSYHPISLREFFMIVCLVWFSLMIREGEIGMKSSAPGDSRGPGTVFTPCNSSALNSILISEYNRTDVAVATTAALFLGAPPCRRPAERASSAINRNFDLFRIESITINNRDILIQTIPQTACIMLLNACAVQGMKLLFLYCH
jgi:hypothetical protein